jgi:hypothetical protein
LSYRDVNLKPTKGKSSERIDEAAQRAAAPQRGFWATATLAAIQRVARLPP